MIKERVAHALDRAGARGLTHRELVPLAGQQWKRRIAELEADGYTFRKDYRKRGWAHVVQVAVPIEPVAVEDLPIADLSLFDAADLGDPVNALLADVAA